jgi:hypothetical protein
MRINIRPNVGGALTGLKATGMVKAIALNWTLPTDMSSYAATQVWWGTSAVLGAATLLDTVNGNSYLISVEDTNQRYFWIRKVNQYGRTDDPYTGPVSVAATLVAGTPGSNGSNGSDGRSYVTAYAASATTTTNTAPGNTNGIDSVPAVNSGGISGTWTKTVPSLSVGQFLYQVDGSYNPTTGVVTWSIPYWSSLRVGSLSAITATIGVLRTRTTGGRVEIADDLIKVFDTNNALRVKIGNLN